jgi:hypothetical protein
MITNIIQFSAIATARPPALKARRIYPQPAKNSRLRIARRDAWWRAGRVTDYWRARLDWPSITVVSLI